MPCRQRRWGQRCHNDRSRNRSDPGHTQPCTRSQNATVPSANADCVRSAEELPLGSSCEGVPAGDAAAGLPVFPRCGPANERDLAGHRMPLACRRKHRRRVSSARENKMRVLRCNGCCIAKRRQCGSAELSRASCSVQLNATCREHRFLQRFEFRSSVPEYGCCRRKNRHRRIQCMRLFHIGTGAPYHDLTLVGAICVSAGARHGVEHGQPRLVRIFARLLDLAKNEEWTIGCDLGIDARIAEQAFRQSCGDGFFELACRSVPRP